MTAAVPPHAEDDEELASEDFVVPAYGTRSLGDVVPGIAHALGAGVAAGIPAPTDLVLPEASAYVVLLIDGLGARALRRHADAAPFLASLAPAAAGSGTTDATAGVPSTTATSLTSLGTGLAPGSHGILGFTTRIPGTDRLLSHLQWDASVDPLAWQPHPTLFQRLEQQGVAVSSVSRREYEDSGLTRAAHRGADFIGAERVGERIAAVQDTMEDRPGLTYVYEGALDRTGHHRGMASAAWLQELSIIDAEAERLRGALPSDVRLVVVADHGMVDTTPDARLDIDDVPGLLDGVWLLGGEARFRHLYCTTRAVDEVLATWREVLGERAVVLAREEAIERGWFGPVENAVRPRLGDVVVACRGRTAIVSRRLFTGEASLIGLHGSLSAEEMLIPVLLA